MKSAWANGLRGMIIALALLSGAAATRAQTPPSSTSAVEDQQPIVVATRVVSEDGRVLSEPVKGINVEIGKPLDRTKVAESLRLLYQNRRLLRYSRNYHKSSRWSPPRFRSPRKSFF